MTIELFRLDPYRKECHARVESADSVQRCFTTDRTVFYPSGGGQPGDSGVVLNENAPSQSIQIVDARRDRTSGNILHFVEDAESLPSAGDRLTLRLDWDRRYLLMRMHSCLHLLCAVIPSRVTGCQVHPGRGRLDFDVSEPLDKNQITYRLNLLIQEHADRRNLLVTADELCADEELAESLSVPAPKNVDRLNLVHFEGIDVQPCGGTHVANTREIGYASVVKIVNKGKRNRRITVVLD